MKKDVQTRRIVVKASLEPSRPLVIDDSGAVSRAEIVVECGAQATVFDTSSSSVHCVHAILEPESELHIISLSRGSACRFTSDVGSGASMHWHCITLGSAEAHTLTSTLSGDDARSDIDWIFAVRGTEKQNIDVRNIFEGRNGGGEITMKGVAEQEAFAAVNGMIEIAEGGQGTDTYLTQDVLMLDPVSKIDAIPGLEIRTNDVKASHSATISRVTVEDLFYFQSRGIDEKTARAMYVEGFLGDLTERIEDRVIREEIQKSLHTF